MYMEEIPAIIFEDLFIGNDQIFDSFLPEIFFSLIILKLLSGNTYELNICSIRSKFNFPIIHKEIFSQIILFICAVIFLYYDLIIEGFFFDFFFFNDLGGRLVKILFLTLFSLGLSCIVQSFIVERLNFFEYFILVLFAVFASLLLINSYDLLSAYLIIEMQSLCFYALACFKRNSTFSIDSGLKYFIFGSIFSILFLTGSVIIYSCLGTLNFNNLTLLLSFYDSSCDPHASFVFFGIICITVTFFAKVAAGPFHFWVVDVYHGSPLGSTILFSIIPKFSIFMVSIRWICTISSIFIKLQNLFFFTGIFSIIYGTLFAIRQKRIKRFIIYSSIVQIGFLILVLGINTLEGFSSLYFFLCIYIVSSILVWGKLSLFHFNSMNVNLFGTKKEKSFFLSNFEGFFNINSLNSYSFLLIFFSLSGIPPLSGFFSKFFIFLSLLESKEYLISFFTICISIVSVFYYVRIVKVIFFESLKIKFENLNFHFIVNKNYFNNVDNLILVCLQFLLIFIFFYPSTLVLLSQLIVLGTFNF